MTKLLQNNYQNFSLLITKILNFSNISSKANINLPRDRVFEKVEIGG